jgi:uncharacterized hydrophobic protein (TIGR00271 family)
MSTDDDAEPARTRTLSPIGDLMHALSADERLMSDEERSAVTDELFFAPGERGPYLWRFFILIVLSTLLAAFGLAADSVAVIIGAMLVAPLMTPIVATAASLLLADVTRLITSLAVIVGGTLTAIGTAMLVTAIGLESVTPAFSLPPEILARTQPSLVDLGVAVAAGLAGGYVVTHPRAGSSLPGVAIAVALVPPLATVGILIQLGNGEAARGAFLLFVTNLIAIVLSAIIVMFLSGFVPPEIRLDAFRSARLGLVVSGLLLFAVAIPLTIHTVAVVQDQRFSQTVIATIPEWDPNAEIEDIRADLLPGGRAELELTVATTSSAPQPSWKLADLLSEQIGRIVDVQIRIRLEVEDAATSG